MRERDRTTWIVGQHRLTGIGDVSYCGHWLLHMGVRTDEPATAKLPDAGDKTVVVVLEDGRVVRERKGVCYFERLG